jgi:ribosomal protein S18 acetylase RimI-like enzyme
MHASAVFVPLCDHCAVEIIELERVAARHWRGSQEEWLGGWLLRAAEGFTGRANSALPLGDPGMPLDAALAAVITWYRARALTPMIAVPLPLDGAEVPAEGSALRRFDNHLSERKWVTRPGPAYVMTAGLDAVAAVPGLPDGAAFRVDAAPDDGWLGMYHYRGQQRQPPVSMTVLMSAPSQVFASIRARAGGEVLAIGRLSIAGDWAGITAVEVNPAHRRRGLGTTLTLAVCAEAERLSARRVFLQVEMENAAALSLYERCGFRHSHRYHYRVAP